MRPVSVDISTDEIILTDDTSFQLILEMPGEICAQFVGTSFRLKLADALKDAQDAQKGCDK